LAGLKGTLLEHARVAMWMHRAKQDDARVAELQNIMKRVIEGEELRVVHDIKVQADFDLFVANVLPVIRGAALAELERHAVHVALPTNGVLTRGLAAATGFGFGWTRAWDGEAVAERPVADTHRFVLLISDRDIDRTRDPKLWLEAADAVVGWDGGMTSHVAVACRSVNRPAVLVSSDEAQMLLRRPFLVVDGTAGVIRSFEPPPEGLDLSARDRRSARAPHD
jgi:phosphohistidine swiveling domain-containing protein